MFASRMPRLSRVGLVILGISSAAEAQACYCPDGSASGYKPCSNAGGACCYRFTEAYRDICYSNGLCQSLYFGRMYQGTCTNKNWRRSCPNVCTGGIQRLLLRSTRLEGRVLRLRLSRCIPVVASTWGSNTAHPMISGNTPTGSATSMPMPAGTNSGDATLPTDACPSTPSIALGAGLAAGLGVPLLMLFAVLLWMLAKQRYNRPDATNMPGKGIGLAKLKEVQARTQSDVLQYGYVGGQHKWEQP
ncbi:uncharacterized protein PG986_011235 [Apiospora aurea]|uniref:Uncharacterized protein n=1 Tax=Apiospora aurea TaxID=335848 RepID=A0ABR1Q581_9PEZI